MASATAAPAPPATERLLTLPDGTRVFCREVGAGAPCLVLHGGLGLDHTYLKPLDALADRLRLVYVDLPGNGRSDRVPREALAIDRLVQAIEDVRQALGHERVLLLGHSYGGALALEYALREPDRVQGLLLVGTVAENGFWGESAQRLRRRDPRLLAAFQDWPDGTDEDFRRWLSGALPAYVPRVTPEVRRLFEDVIVDVRTWAWGNEALAGFSATSRLPGLRAPTLVLHGRSDIVPVSQAYRLQSGIPDVRLVVLEESGHFPYAEEPEAFSAAVRAWLSDLPAA